MIYNITENYFEKYASKETIAKIVRYGTLSEMWKNCAEKYSADTAIEDGEKYTYAQLDADAASVRGVLAANGIKKGDRVGIFAPNSYNFAKLFIACSTYGAVSLLLPAHLDSNSLMGCCMKYGLKALIYDPAFAEKTAPLAALAGKVALISSDETAQPAPICDDLCAADDCTIIFTGGTTGKSKGAMLSHGAVMTGVVNGCYGFDDLFGERYFLVLPLTHVFGLIRNLLTSLYTGSVIYICRNTKDMFREIAVFKPTFLVIVPALAELGLTLSKQFGRNMLGDSLKYIVCGASAVAPHLVTEYHAMGITLYPGYGLTESANLVCGNPECLRKNDSVGLPYPGQQLRIVDGELWIKGDNIMTAYIGEDEAANASFEDGWLKTGDLVRIDDEGFLYIVGRKKDIIVLSTGEKISPEELEAKFAVVNEVQDCMVYEDIAANGNQILTLEIVPRPTEIAKFGAGAADYLKGELEKINASIPAFMRVNKIIIRDKDFDRTPAMKKIRIKKVQN